MTRQSENAWQVRTIKMSGMLTISGKNYEGDFEEAIRKIREFMIYNQIKIEQIETGNPVGTPFGSGYLYINGKKYDYHTYSGIDVSTMLAYMSEHPVNKFQADQVWGIELMDDKVLRIFRGSYKGNADEAIKRIRDFVAENDVRRVGFQHWDSLYINGQEYNFAPDELDIDTMLRYTRIFIPQKKSSSVVDSGLWQKPEEKSAEGNDQNNEGCMFSKGQK